MHLTYKKNVILAVELDVDLSYSTWVQYKKYVSKERQDMIDRFMHQEDKIRCLWAGLLIRKHMNEITEIPIENQQYSMSGYGKPKLCYTDICFNLSHSGERIFACFANNDLGVDVEKIMDAPFYIMDGVFNESEMAYIQNATNQTIKNERFYEIWTCKEAYGKCKGWGINYEMQNYNTRDAAIRDSFRTWIRDGYCYSVYMDVEYDVELLHETINEVEDYMKYRKCTS